MSSQPIAPFSLTRCTASDLPELMLLQYNSFPPFVRTVFMGCETPLRQTQLDAYVAKVTREYATNSSEVWMGVRDTATGKFVAGSHWRVFPSGEKAPEQVADSPPENLKGEELEASRKVIREMDEARRKFVEGPFVHLHICFTDEKYRRRGAGAMMMKWGVDLMDALFLPGYIEASKEGNFLYKAFGFYELDRVGGSDDEGAVAMRRDARRTPIYGGKPALG